MILYMIGKLAPISTHFTRGLVKFVPGRGYFRAIPSQNGDKFSTSPTPQSLNDYVYCGLKLDRKYRNIGNISYCGLGTKNRRRLTSSISTRRSKSNSTSTKRKHSDGGLSPSQASRFELFRTSQWSHLALPSLRSYPPHACACCRRRRKLAARQAAKAGDPAPGGLSDLKIGVLGCMAERLKVGR